MNARPDFQMSADARLLLGHMREASVGQFFSYADLAAVISRPVSGASGSLHTAMRRLLRDHDMVFACVRGKGVQRLDDRGIVDEGSAAADRIRRRARRSLERMSKADFSSLPREHQARFSAHTSIMAVVAHMTGAAQVNRIERQVSPQARELPIAETMRMFAK